MEIWAIVSWILFGLVLLMAGFGMGLATALAMMGDDEYDEDDVDVILPGEAPADEEGEGHE